METTDWRLWGTFGVAVISLLWNLANTIYTHKSSKKTRRQAVRLDEFKKSVRDPIVSAMDGCEAVGSRAEAISASAKPLIDVMAEIEQLNRDAIAALNLLSDKLNDADNSSFSKSSAWLSDYDEFEEKILGCFNEACNAVNSDARRREALARVKTIMRSFKGQLQRRQESEITAISEE